MRLLKISNVSENIAAVIVLHTNTALSRRGYSQIRAAGCITESIE